MAAGAWGAVAPPADKLAEGERVFWAGDYVTAELAFFEVLMASPDEAAAHFYLGRIFQERGQLERAGEQYEAAAGSDYRESYFFLGLVYFQQRRFDDSVAAYEKYLAAYGDDATAWYNLGVTYDAAGRGDKAEESYEAALAANPRHGPSVFNLAVLYYRRGDYGRSAFFWRRYLELAGDSADGFYGLGLAHYKAGDYVNAARAFHAGVQAAPLEPRFFYELGRTYLKLGEYEPAATMFTRAHELGYDEGAIAEGLGLALEGGGQYDRAIPLLKRAAEIRGSRGGEAYAALGRIERQRGRAGEAMGDFYEAAARLDDPAEAYNQIGELYMEQDLPSWAAGAFRRAVAASPANISYQHNLATAYDRASPRDALAAWRRYVELAGVAPGEERRVAKARKRISQLLDVYGEEERP